MKFEFELCSFIHVIAFTLLFVIHNLLIIDLNKRTYNFSSTEINFISEKIQINYRVFGDWFCKF